MSDIQIAYRPELTRRDLLSLFKEQFGHVYDLYETRRFGRDFVVKKNNLSTIGVTLRQDPGRTVINLHPFSASMMLNMLLGSYLASLMLRPLWKNLEKEIGRFVLMSAELE